METATWGTGYAVGLSAGIYNATHRIRDMESKHGSDLTLDMIIDYLEKDSAWELRDLEGWSGQAFMETANGWSAGWWNIDS